MITGEKTKKRNEAKERKENFIAFVRDPQCIQMKGLTNIEYQVYTSEREHRDDDPSAWRVRYPSLAENKVTKFPCKLSRVLFAILPRTPTIFHHVSSETFICLAPATTSHTVVLFQGVATRTRARACARTFERQTHRKREARLTKTRKSRPRIRTNSPSFPSSGGDTVNILI